MIEKTPVANRKTVKVTFALPADAAEKSVAVVGDFNEWDENKDKMKLDKKNGVWSKTLTLKSGNSYQFRYFVDESKWVNDDQADRIVPSPYFSENSVVEV